MLLSSVREIKIGAYIYKVLHNYLFKERVDIQGQVDFGLLEIRISHVDLSGNIKPTILHCETCVHEIIECINHIYLETKLTEAQIVGLSEGLIQVIVDNGGINI